MALQKGLVGHWRHLQDYRDEFNTGSLSSKWETFGSGYGTIDVSGGELTISQTAGGGSNNKTIGIRSKETFKVGQKLKVRSKNTSGRHAAIIGLTDGGSNPFPHGGSSGASVTFYSRNDNTSAAFSLYDESGNTQSTNFGSADYSTYHEMEIIRPDGSTIEIYADGSLIDSFTSVDFSDPKQIYFAADGYTTPNTIVVDYAEVKNYKTFDNSAYDNHGDGIGGVSGEGYAPSGSAMAFDGDSTYISLPQINQTLTEVTMSTWIKTRTTVPSGGDNHTVGLHMQNNNGWRVYTSGSSGEYGIWVRDGGNVQSNTSSASQDVGEWTHIVATITNNNVSLYKNTNQVVNSSINWPGKSGGYPVIGKYENGGYYTDGFQSDIRLYNRALSQPEITQLYNQRSKRTHGMTNVPVAQQDLVAHYPFASSGATDQSGSGYDGTTNSGTYRSTGGHNGNGDYNLQKDYISAPVPSSVQGGGSKSLVGWSYHNSIDSSNHFYNFGSASGDQAFGWYVPSGNLKIYHFGNDSDTGYNVPTGKWIHLVLTYDGSSTSKAYVNGSLQHTYNSGSLNTGNTRLAIGGREDETKTVPNANFSDIRIYDKELSRYEVKRLYEREGNIFGGSIKDTSYQGNRVVVEEDEYGTWLLVQNYEHYGGENPTVSRGSNFPSMPNRISNRKLRISDIQSIGTSAEIQHVDNISQYGITNVSAVRLEAETSNHNRKINYFTENQTVIDSIVDDNTKAGHSELKDQITKYDDHTANLPDNGSSNQTDNRTDRIFGYGFPMYKGGTHHWAVAGYGNRWEVDDYPNNASNTTIHRVWARI